MVRSRSLGVSITPMADPSSQAAAASGPGPCGLRGRYRRDLRLPLDHGNGPGGIHQDALWSPAVRKDIYFFSCNVYNVG